MYVLNPSIALSEIEARLTSASLIEPILASMILTLHNLKFYWELMSAIRNSIKNGQFDQFFNKYIDLL